MIKAFIFDLGNVIVNVDRENLFTELAISSNKTVKFIEEYYKNSIVRKSFERGNVDAKQFYSIVAKDLNLKMSFSRFKKAYCSIFTLNKGVAQLIRKLRKCFKLILLSNTDALHFEHIKRKYNVINEFDECVLSYKVGYRKPNPLIFLDALRKAKALSINCVYVDDVAEFVFIARLMGIKAFQYRSFKKLIEDIKIFL